MSRKPPATAADYMIVAINPALIMLLVGSVLFFLCEVFYRGQYEGRLTFICAMYVMGIVAVSRISMEEGTGYAAGFGAPLAAVVYIAFFKFVEFHGPLAALSPLLNGVFLIFTWWLAYNLTWDCTLLDDKADASGQGLLEAAGFDTAAGESTNPAATPAANASSAVPPAPERPSAPMNAAEKLLAEKEKYERERLEQPSFFTTWFEADRRPRAQGVWVLWFGAIALPIFGVMQWFVPTSDTTSRVWCLQLLLVYVGSSLALLLNTSFLSLRRYLRQRKLEMPLEMAGVWMIVGAALIGGVMLFCLLLPRPGAEVAISQPPITFGNSGLNPSRWGTGNDGKQQPGGSGQNQPGQQQGSSSSQQSSSSQGSQSSGSKSQGSQGQSSQGQGSQGQGAQGQSSQSQGSQSQASQPQGSQPQGAQPPGGSSAQNPPSQQNASNSSSGPKSDPASGQNQQTNTGPQNSGQQPSGQASSGQQSAGQQSSGQTPGKSPSNSSNSGPQPMPGANPSQNSSGNAGAKSPESGSQTGPTPSGGKQPEKAPSNPTNNNQTNNSSPNNQSASNPSSGDPSKSDPSKSDPNVKTNPGEKSDPSKSDVSKSDGAKSPEASKASPGEPTKTNQSGSSNSSSAQSGPSQSTTSQGNTSQQSQSNPQSSPSASTPPPAPPRQSNFRLPSVQVPASLGNLLKLLLWAAIAVAIVVGLIHYREQLVAAWKQLLDDLAKLWARLFGGGEVESAAAQAATAKAVTPPRPFASYPNPFTSGLAARMPPPQLMGHTLAAAEAFGRERGFPRDESETPHEYLARLFQQSPEIVQMALAFAETYGQIAFGKGAPPQQAHAASKRLWQVMSTTPPPPPMPAAPQLQTSQR